MLKGTHNFNTSIIVWYQTHTNSFIYNQPKYVSFKTPGDRKFARLDSKFTIPADRNTRVEDWYNF